MAGREGLGRAGWWGRWLALLLFLALGLGELGRGPDLHAGDYAQYLLHARALAEHRPYTDTGYIYTAQSSWTGPRVLPPGFPLVLALASTVAGFEPAFLRGVVLAFGGLFLWLVGGWIARHRDEATACGVMLMLAVSPTVLGASTSLLSDIPFAAAAWGLAVVYDRPGAWSGRRIALAMAVLLAALSLRTAAVALLPAIAIHWALVHGRTGLGPLVPLLLVGALGLCAAAAALATASAGPEALQAMVAGSIDWIGFHPQRLWQYRFPFFEALLYPFPWDIANDAYHVLATGVAALGLAAWLRTSYATLLVAFGGTYLLLLLVAPPATGRYLWVLLPLAPLGLLAGVQRLLPVRPASEAARRYVAPGLAVLLAALALALGPEPSGAPSLAERPEARELFRFFAEPRERPPRVVFVKPRVLAWETGAASMPSFWAPPEVILRELERKRITHVVVGSYGLNAPADEALSEAIRARPERFEAVFSNAEFSVYRHRPEGRGAGAPAAGGRGSG